MPTSHPIAEQFLAALTASEAGPYHVVLAETVGLRRYGLTGLEVYRPRERVVAHLLEEWRSWPDATLETLNVLGEGERLALEFRIQATQTATGRYVEYLRSAFLTVENGQVTFIDLYCPAPVPSARRHGWIAPATLTAPEVERLFDTLHFAFDPREWVQPQVTARTSLQRFWGTFGSPHPGSNQVSAAHWSAAETDAHIAELIAWHRARGLGFQWWVAPTDEPADLAQRLEAHGFALAGPVAMMAKLGLTDPEQIPINPALRVRLLDGSDDDAIETRLQISGQCFNWTPEQINQRRPMFFARAKDPRFQERELHYLADLGGVPVADARLVLEAGVAYLGGAATLPAYRSQRIYSTLLRRRLEDARDRGYQLAAIHAEPMSRRVVVRYGFQEYARVLVYAWMPEMDLAIIKSLVPDE